MDGGPLTDEPPPLNEPAAIPSEDLSLGTLHFMYDFHYDISTVKKITALIAAGVPEIYKILSKTEQKLECLQTRDVYILP